METERRYDVSLTWDEIDSTQAAIRDLIYRYENECKTAEPSLVAELDQCIAGWWETVHRLGDARRAAHGQPLVLGPVELSDL